MSRGPDICVQLLSDLHLENPAAYDIFDVDPHAPYLALIGDIGHVEDKDLFAFLKRQLHHFHTVLFLLGNHEPYHSSWTATKAKVRTFERSIEDERRAGNANLGTFFFLDQTRIDISPSLTILGCTLFSQILPARRDHVSFGLNDFYHIQDWTVDQHTEAHSADLAWLNEQVSSIAASEPERRVVVLTHHSPTSDVRAIDPNHAGSRISSGFMTDLSIEECWVNPAVKVWMFGHTHFNCDFVDEETGKRVVANQRGYYFSQAENFDPHKVVLLGE